MKLIRATKKDIQALLEIEDTTIGSRVYSRWQGEEEMRRRLEDEVVYLIENEGVIVGNISYEIINDDQAEVSTLVINGISKAGTGKRGIGLAFG